MYVSQILSNVDNLKIVFTRHNNDWEFIQFAQKLRHLKLFECEKKTIHQTDQIISMLDIILLERNNGQEGGDFIKIALDWKESYELFEKKTNEYNQLACECKKGYYIKIKY